MERVEAVQAAKNYARELFSKEGISRIRLEEMNFDADKYEWLITVSFAYALAPSPLLQNLGAPLLQNFGQKRVYGQQQYKVVHIRDRDGEFIGLTDRMLAPLS